MAKETEPAAGGVREVSLLCRGGEDKREYLVA